MLSFTSGCPAEAVRRRRPGLRLADSGVRSAAWTAACAAAWKGHPPIRETRPVRREQAGPTDRWRAAPRWRLPAAQAPLWGGWGWRRRPQPKCEGGIEL